MEALARLVARRGPAWVIVIVTFALGGVATQRALHVAHDDDLLAFLPTTNPEVGSFYEVNKRFGVLDLAIVGVETEDVFDAAFLERLRKVTGDLNDLPELSDVLSLANVEDFTPNPEGGIVQGLLVDVVPQTPEAKAALRAKVMSREVVVGNLVSEDSKGAVIYCAMAPGADPRLTAGQIRQVVTTAFVDDDLYYAGNPFIAGHIFDTTQEDMRVLTPWAVAAILLIVFLAFKSFIGTALALLSTGIGIQIAIGTMAILGVPFNIVLGGMPVILFAVGSAYGIHILGHYFRHARTHDPAEAIRITLVSVGPVVAAAGLTTVAGLLSFVLMDIPPLRIFGVFTALGILVTLILSLTFIPAVVVLFGLKGADRKPGRLARGLGATVAELQTRHRSAAIGLVIVGIFGAAFTYQVDSRMDPKAFYAVDSEPDHAERFLGRQFGGSQVIQFHVRADLKDPLVLREIGRLADVVRVHPSVEQVLDVGQVISVANSAMEGEARVPDTRAKIGTLFGLLEGKPSVRQLAADDRTEALVQIKLGSRDAAEFEGILDDIEAMVAREAVTSWEVAAADGPRAADVAARLADVTATRLHAVAGRQGVAFDDEALRAALTDTTGGGDTTAVVTGIVGYLRGGEALVDLPEPSGGVDPAQVVAKAVAALGPEGTEDARKQAIAKALAKPADDELVDDLEWALSTPLGEIWRRHQVEGGATALLTKLGVDPATAKSPEALSEQVAMALLTLKSPTAALAPGGAEAGATAGGLKVSVTGLPVLHRGLSRSVTANQFKSLSFALGMVFIIMIGLFRSFTAGLLATAPTALTLLVIYGGMAVMGVQLDIGTSMLASLIIGAGVDYAVHLMSAWKAEHPETLRHAADRATTETGLAIWTNALAVAAGFFVLTLGDSRPLQNVGGLTSAAMLTAAIATFAVIPAFARRLRYRSERSA